MKVWLRRIAKSVGILLLIVLLLLVGAYLLLQIRSVRGFVVDKIVNQLNSSLNGRIEVEHIEGPLLGSASAKGIRIFDGRHNLAAELDEASIHFRLLPLLKKQIIIDLVDASKATALVRTYDDGTLNWTTLATPSDDVSEPSTIAIFVDDLRLTDTTIVYLDEATAPDDDPDLAMWQNELARALDNAHNADELRNSVPTYFDPEKTAPFNGPAAPIAAWIDDLELQGNAKIYGQNVHAHLDRLRTTAQTEILPEPLKLVAENLDFTMSPTTLEAHLKSLELTDWIDVQNIEAALILPPSLPTTSTTQTLTPQKNGIGGVAGPPEETPSFELAVAALNRITLDKPLLSWAVPGIEIATPITIEGQLRADPDQASLLAKIKANSITEPITLTAKLDDYLHENPRYLLSLSADQLATHAWIPDPAPITLSTHAAITLEGRGFEPKTLEAHLRAGLEDSLVDETYKAHLIALEIKADQKRIESQQIVALTPYLDLFASLDLDLNGEAHLRARTTADTAQTEAAQKLIDPNGSARPTRADLTLDAQASFSPDLDDPLKALQTMTASANWTFAGFQAEEIHIGQSRGDLAIDLTKSSSDPPHDDFRSTYRINASGRRINTPFANIAALELQDRGALTARYPFDDPIQALRNFENKARLRATGLLTPQFELQSLRLAADLKKSPARSDRINAKVDLGLEGAAASGFTLKSARSTFAAQASLGPVGDPFKMIRSFSWKGEIFATDLHSESLSLRQAHLGGELAGPLDNPLGALLLELQELDLPGESLPVAVLSLALPGDRRAQLELDARRAPGGSYHLAADLSFAPTFQAFTLTALELGTDRALWTSAPDGLIRWTGAQIEADDFLLANNDQALHLQGALAPGLRQDLTLAIQSLDLAKLRHDFYLQDLLPKMAGQIDLSTSLQGTARSPKAQAALDLQDLFIDDTGPINLNLAANYDAERLALKHLSLNAFDEPILEMSAMIPLRADLQGRAQVLWDEHFDVHLDTSKIRLRDFHAPIPALNQYGIDGLLEATLKASGRVDDPRITLDLDLENFRFQGMLGSDDDETAHGTAPRSTQLQTAPSTGEYITLRDINLEAALSYHSQHTGGDGLDAKAALFWEDELALEALIKTPLPLEEWAQAAMNPEHDAPFWRHEFLSLPFRLRLHLPTLELSRIPVESLQQQNIAGQAKVDIDLEGTLDDPRGKVDLAFNGVGWDRFRDLDFHFQAHIRDHLARIDRIDLTWGDDEIFIADGAIPLPITALLAGQAVDDLPIDLRLQLQELPVSRLSPIDYGFARIRGSMAAFVEVGGSLRAPKFRSRAGLFNTMLGDGSAGTIYMELTGADDEITVHGAACHRVDPFLSVDGRAPVQLDLIALALGEDWRLPGELALRVHGEEIQLASDLPLQLLSDFLIDPAGTLAIDLEASGSWEEPTMTGFVEMNDAALTLPEYSRRFTNIEGRVEVDERTISIPGFAVADGPSKAFLSGTIEHEFFTPQHVDINLDADQFNIGGFGVDFPVFLTAKVTVDGEPIGEPGRLKVHISGLEVVLTDEWDQSLHPTDLDDDVIVLGRDRGGAPQAAEIVQADSPLDELHLIVDVTIDRDAWARHPNGDINLAADVTAEITGKVVAITGSVDALRGELEFLGRLFVVRESQITFIGAVPTDPRLQIEAHHPMDRAVTQSLGPPSSGEPRIIFRITGTASAPRLELRSDPVMTDTEILSVLMTGRPPDRSDVGQDEGVAGQALAAVGGLFFGLLQEELAGTVPVDVLRLEPVGPGAEGGRLEVGKYITSDLFLSYRRQFGADEDIASNVIRLEYHFLPRWMVELLYTDRNEGGLNIYWDVY